MIQSTNCTFAKSGLTNSIKSGKKIRTKATSSDRKFFFTIESISVLVDLSQQVHAWPRSTTADPLRPRFPRFRPRLQNVPSSVQNALESTLGIALRCSTPSYLRLRSDRKIGSGPEKVSRRKGRLGPETWELDLGVPGENNTSAKQNHWGQFERQNRFLSSSLQPCLRALYFGKNLSIYFYHIQLK